MDIQKKIDQEQIVDANTGLESKYIKLDLGKRMYVTITNWRTIKTVKAYKDEQPKEVTLWRADVIKYGESPLVMNVCALERKTLELGNVTFRKAINMLLADKTPTKEYTISIKKIGEGKATTYDVELLA